MLKIILFLVSIYLIVKIKCLQEEYETKLVNILRIYDIDILFLIGYMRIVSPILINEYRGNIFNIHPSLLPLYSGLMDLQVHQKVIDNQDKITGCTLHLVTEELDGGDIIRQKQTHITTNNPIELKQQIQQLESNAIIECVQLWSNLPYNYKSSGVDINKGNQFVEYIKSISQNTRKHIGGFCATYHYNGIQLATATDGIGTKLDLAIDNKKYDTIGIDLVAMSINELYAGGAKPLFFLDYLAVDKLDISICQDIITGINNGCQISDCLLIGGETAEMNGIYRYGKLDVAGFAVGVVKYQIPKTIEVGNFIYGIKSNGIHSNGYTLIRKILKYSKYDLQSLLQPTRIYTEILDLLDKYHHIITGIAHITGGGHIDNITRLLTPGISFQYNKWEFPDVFK